MPYRYDLHVHASGCSLCARRTPTEMVRACHAAGFAGMALTDHFLNGYTAVDKSLPWEEKISRYWQSYEEARAEGDRLGLDILFGLEYAYGGGKEVLTYGIDRDFLLSYPDLCAIPLEEYAARVRAAGGYLSQAHPFRRRPYIDDTILPCVELLDGLEVFNGGNDPLWDQEAWDWAQRYALGGTAGSDAHDIDSFGRAGIVSPRRLKTGRDLVSALREGECRPFRIGIDGPVYQPPFPV